MSIARHRPPPGPDWRRIGLWMVRYGIGIVMLLAGVALLAISPDQLGVDGFAMAFGGGLSVLLINLLFRLGASGDREREQEEAARRYFDEHGVWPTKSRAVDRTANRPPDAPDDQGRSREDRAGSSRCRPQDQAPRR